MSEKIEALRTALEYIPKLKKGIKDIYESYESGEYEKGAEIITEASDGFQWIINLIALTKDVLKEELDESELTEKFSEVIEAMENEDYILVGDLFQYEVYPIIENYENVISKSLLN
ncbi:hypothetical protein BJV85_001680 [Clostridium acetobutylicum]|uniref:DUF8042 domain-containing protein n=1 Tax=Clostridium acetobutylicum (strain ATCC 824 / DSM 792 / JCM 1419 / IAM 19013 / LMG 5710 / NBRC 13948 / NRRL B-527 / VKM B-1787 / 2291 / W) TaxID=272562 RepID=Q97H13_CLOAB|nr:MULTISPECIES: hypothetical protein [Clostridium]AAK80158.1 Hypothetical protein CA_C2201 [Clostridium acetobutylicum ATCC 824]ADZ21252.1 Conserved hypothetical protein [Clostridium acetobutylicum EA 2018]AEI32229.1 hypothetical protein SMB_G2234 [Clostridium acetobutylicum DSM 1731]AWV79416.1 hypothetical protein DK921_04745 [Clostridium acetobutylicum]KHD38344.1 hypothetical protein NL50_02230 [Clostridium acetobutylicum]